MIRQTSVDAYNMIKENGLLSQRRFEVYDVLFNHGPLTQGETCDKITPGWKRSNQSYTPRFAELKKLGVIIEIGERECSITGRKALSWDVTDKLPLKFEKPTRHKCNMCDGKGYIEEAQAKLFE